ncbi:hypothetical protein J4E86_001221 [Alternaria arbusti]|uniref:uncharacterized protein n=1 Tax=Alternaria arbusti TaxID=232088 RepID=UPI0022203DF6|nr:uncharacterized protein J4E86_001221 [Alternaria arbusti]KAI4962189.1 hypothetical protein J4E86_001221 [Alternaria arbusti]
MTILPVSQADVNTLTYINLLVKGIFPFPHPSAAVKLGCLKNELGIVKYRARFDTSSGKPVELMTDLIEVQVADSRSEVLLKLLEAVEDYAGMRTLFPEVPDERESEEDYAEEQRPGEPEENEDE